MVGNNDIGDKRKLDRSTLPSKLHDKYLSVARYRSANGTRYLTGCCQRLVCVGNRSIGRNKHASIYPSLFSLHVAHII